MVVIRTANRHDKEDIFVFYMSQLLHFDHARENANLLLFLFFGVASAL